MKALSVVFMLFLSLVTFSSRDLIEDICRSSSDFKSLTKAKSIYNEIVSLLKQEKEPVLKQSLQVCKENYDNVIDDAISSIKYFYANDFNGAKSLASGVASGPETCEESFSEPPIRTSPIKDFYYCNCECSDPDTCEETFNEPAITISPIKSKDDNFMNFIGLTMNLIEDVCRTSSDFKVCINALRADPKSFSADKKGLVRILLQQCLTKAKNIYNEVANLLEQAKEHVLIQCLQICKENYDSAIDVATTAIKDFDANDFFGAKITASAIVNCADTCEESFTEPPIRTSPTKSKSEDLMNFVGLTLSLVKQFSN
ncbi:hypothetical protein H5410_053101 [Solanum commersonii]|uniref:Pectinesterase inhibitor domain-containing protein n=1 Tax=Solanum commersonii TaxID=4109 RepID=A0A9J5X3F5_SOLCO|nr:hypothetical protein H5410_053101 [Solanum commersonii]